MLATKAWVKDLINKTFKKASKYNFSTEEQKIGTWTDGKPLYQKTIAFTSPSTKNTSVTVSLSDLKIKAITSIDGVLIASDNTFIPINMYCLPGDYTLCTVSTTQIILYIPHSAYLNRPVYATIQYTKTTD